MEHIIEVSGLQKSYGQVPAVKGIDFYVEQGKIFAFLGPNGAGKSTTIDIICTFLQSDAGKVEVDGHLLGRDDNAIRHTIGAVFQDGLLDPLLTVSENLHIRAGFYGLKGKQLEKTIRDIAERMGIQEIMKRPYGKLSGGQRRRCDIARALVNTPKILFLDEPTTGLDPQTRKSVWETITKLQHDTGMTIFLTTHYMEEAAEADYVIVIDNGNIVAKGTPSDLKERFTSDKLTLTTKEAEALASRLTAAGLAPEVVADRVTLKVPNTLAALPLLDTYKDAITGFTVTTGTMDDAFIAITGKEIRE
ncbi:MAG: ABC transporter [Firmicutes bacterium HGW-Firmicutes-9]|nr:MAG: ABC transporter [Firmicutes bacterium HGW-Firmicutes-9]